MRTGAFVATAEEDWSDYESTYHGVSFDSNAFACLRQIVGCSNAFTATPASGAALFRHLFERPNQKSK